MAKPKRSGKKIVAERRCACCKEIVICAATKTTCGQIIRGHRHIDCLNTIKRRGLKHAGPDSQGFVTSRNRFVDREEGLKIQLAAGIPCVNENRKRYHCRELFSEDVY